jgi:hypothetical protein
MAVDPDTGEVIDFLGQDRDPLRGMAVGTLVITSLETPFWSSGIVATIGEAAPLGTKIIAGVSPWGALLGAVSIVWIGWKAYLESTDPRFDRQPHPYSYPEQGRVFYEQRFIDDSTLFGSTATYYIYRMDQVLADGNYHSWVEPKQIVGFFSVNSEDEPQRGFVMSLQLDETKVFIPGSHPYLVLTYLAEIVGEIEEQVGEDYYGHPAGVVTTDEGKALAEELNEFMGSEDQVQLYPIANGRCLDAVDELEVMEDLKKAKLGLRASVARELVDAILQDHMDVRYTDHLYDRAGGSGAVVYFPTATFSGNNRYYLLYTCVTTNGYGGWQPFETAGIEFDEASLTKFFPYEYGE